MQKKSWEPFRSCLLNSSENSAHFHQNWAIEQSNPKWLPGFCFLSNILIFIYFFEYETIETHARAFLTLNILSIGTVTYFTFCILFTRFKNQFWNFEIQIFKKFWWTRKKFYKSCFFLCLFFTSKANKKFGCWIWWGKCKIYTTYKHFFFNLSRGQHK